MGHRFHPSVLREYDVRGIVGETLLPGDARALGRAFGTVLARGGGRVAAVGYDGRDSSPAFEAEVVEGLRAAGIDVERVGLGPTPLLYFAVEHRHLDGGVMVTGSHNPPAYNGFKMMRRAAGFYGPDIKALGAMAEAGDFASGQGQVREVSLFDSYIERIARDYGEARGLHVVWDAGNGSAGPAMAALAKRLPGRHTLLYAEIDSRFPHHHPDPTEPKNLADLRAAVASEGADIGIAFDGDGDRIGVVDGEGRILWGDQIMMLLAREVLAARPGSTIIADVKASQALFDEIARLGGVPLMWKTGHSLIKAKMAETGAPLAGEMSGHLFFADRYYGFDDALYAAVRLLAAVANSGQSLAELRDSLPEVVNTPELRFPCAEERKFAVIEDVRARLAAAGARVDAVDGVRVNTSDGWWLLRASNTQDALVARCEARDQAGLARLKSALSAAVRASGLEPPAI